MSRRINLIPIFIAVVAVMVILISHILYKDHKVHSELQKDGVVANAKVLNLYLTETVRAQGSAHFTHTVSNPRQADTLHIQIQYTASNEILTESFVTNISESRNDHVQVYND